MIVWSYAYEYNDLSLFYGLLHRFEPIKICLLQLCFSQKQTKNIVEKGNRHFLDLFSIKSSDKFTSSSLKSVEKKDEKKREKMKN